MDGPEMIESTSIGCRADFNAEGVTLNDFMVVCAIGKGGSGIVYLVENKNTKERFAMKEIEVLPLALHQGSVDTLVSKNTNEHPFIVRYHYAFQTEHKLYLVMDLLAGGELFFHLDKAPDYKFEESRVKFYTAQIGLAIGHLHSLDIIYRDLKPENCVLDKDGNVVLTDFGLAKAHVNTARSSPRICGTPDYIAPEFLRGESHGKAVDWWVLGILMYEMLHGRLPFFHDDFTTFLKLMLTGDIVYDEGISPEAKDLLSKLLVRESSKRLQNVDEFKAHRFFADIDWVKLYNKQIPPPFKPDANPINNFSAEFTTMKVPFVAMMDAERSHHQVNFNYNRIVEA
jgi:serum/glucocorticoid-regulated kinase 2